MLDRAETTQPPSPAVSTHAAPSLVVEMAMCLIYPFMAFATGRFNTGMQVVILAGVVWRFGWSQPQFEYGQVQYGLPILAFYLGLIVPTVGRAVIRRLGRIGTP